jgi:hypothetical protein
MRVRLALFIISLLITACAQSTIKETDLKMADYGQSPPDYKERINKHWQSVLKDPSSLQVQSIGEPEKGAIYTAIEKPHWYDAYSDVNFVPIYGYRVCTIYNAKNSFGAYTGFKAETFFFDRKGTLIVPIPVTKEVMEEMHMKGTFSTNVKVTKDPCHQ